MKITGVRFPPKGGCEVQVQIGDRVAIARVDQDAVASTGARAIPLMLDAIMTTAQRLQREVDEAATTERPDAEA